MPSNGIVASVEARQALKPPVRSCGARPQDDPREEAAAARDQAPAEAPVDDAAARRVARADHEIGRPVDDRARSAPAGRPGRATSRRPSGRRSRRRRRGRPRSRRGRPVRGPAWPADGGPGPGRRPPRARRRGRRSRRATRRRRRAASPRAATARIAAAMPGRFSASLYVGRTTHAPATGVRARRRRGRGRGSRDGRHPR